MHSIVQRMWIISRLRWCIRRFVTIQDIWIIVPIVHCTWLGIVQQFAVVQFRWIANIQRRMIHIEQKWENDLVSVLFYGKFIQIIEPR